MRKRTSYPLRDCQKGMIIGSISHPESTYYNNTSYICTIPEEVDPHKLADAVIETVNAHPYWKSFFRSEKGAINQIPNDDAPVNVSVTEISDSEIEGIEHSFVSPFNIFEYPLYKIYVYHSPEKTYLLFSFHHSIFDVRSCTVFLDDIFKAYDGGEIPCETFDSFDYSLLEQKEIEEGYAQNKEFFDRYTEGCEPSKLPSIPSEGKGDIRSESFSLKYDDVSHFCSQQGVSPNNLITSALALAVSYYTGVDDVMIFATHHGRNEERVQRTAGMYVTTMPVRIKISQNEMVSDLLSGVRKNLKELWTKQPFPFFGYFSSKKYEMGIVINYQYKLTTGHPIDYLRISGSPIPFALYVFVSEASFEVRGVYDDSLYCSEYISEFMSSLHVCIDGMMKDASRKAGELPLMKDSSKEMILALSRGEELPLNKDENFLSFFHKVVTENRDSIAVVDYGSSFTYWELDEASDFLAERLLAKGIEKGDRVAVMLHRRKEYVSSVIAIMKVGGIFVPIDLEYPDERISYILEDSKARCLVKDKDGTICLEDGISDTTNRPKGDGAYMIYTSGSTGKPKGVIISHKSLYAFIMWMRNLFELKNTDRVTSAASFSFDAFILDSFPVLSSGAQLHILSEEVRVDLSSVYHYIIDKKISGGFFTTMFAVELLKCYHLPLRYLGLGGEKCPSIDYNPDMKIINMYGPTEFTVVSSFHVLHDHENTEIPIGKPVPNSRLYVLDGHGRLLPKGVIGELYLSGVQLSDGYFGKADLTEERFIPNPYSDSPTFSKMYRTGDLVRWNPEGELEFIGRTDHQVKLRGYRIELGEIESAIDQYPGITMSKAVLYTRTSIHSICVYFTASEKIDIKSLSAFISGSLASYMLPSSYMQLDSFPVTSNDKIDVARLPEPDFMQEESVPPSSVDEKKLCSIIQNELHNDRLGITDDLFQFGMDSLIVMILAAKAEKEGVHISISDIYKGRTIQGILRASSPDKSLVYWKSESNSEKPVVVLVCGASPASVIQSIIENFSLRYSLLVVDFLENHYQTELKGKDYPGMVELLTDSIKEKIAGNCVSAFCGHCLGGEIAYAIAARWAEKGTDRPEVWLFNSFAERTLSYPTPTWSLALKQELIWKNHLELERICNILLRGRYMPSYSGLVKLFYATRPTYNIASSDLPPVSDDPAVLEQIKIFFRNNPANWKKYALNLKTYPIDADHWTIVDEFLAFYL